MEQNILTKKEQDLVLISAYSAKGNLDNLKSAVNTAFDDGMTVNEIKETMVQMYAYCGFPKSLNALATLKAIVDSRSDVKEGKAGVKLPAGTDKFAYGDKVQVELTGKHVTGPLFDFAPAIDEYLKEHLFADIFARGVLSYQEREIATISALSVLPGVAPQLNAHINIGKNNGLTEAQVDAILTLASHAFAGGDFGVGVDNVAYAKYFIGKSYLNPLIKEGLPITNVTFEPKCRNNWHIHHKGGQILICVSGRGYYQEWGCEAQECLPGTCIYIKPEVKHWHGASKNSWFSHIALSVPAEGASSEWLEEVTDEDYNKLP